MSTTLHHRVPFQVDPFRGGVPAPEGPRVARAHRSPCRDFPRHPRQDRLCGGRDAPHAPQGGTGGLNMGHRCSARRNGPRFISNTLCASLHVWHRSSFPAIASHVDTPCSPAPCLQFLNRSDGTYGPIPSRRPLGMLSMPFNRTSVQGLYCVGDSTFPGQGVVRAYGRTASRRP